MNPVQRQMIEEFQCPGCVCGAGVDSGCYEPDGDQFTCDRHCAGTLVSHIGTINLGLPKGFNRLGPLDQRVAGNTIRLYESVETMPQYNEFNVPVWGMERDGYLFVRCYMPRVNQTYVDVIKGGTIANLPDSVINVAEFWEGMD